METANPCPGTGKDPAPLCCTAPTARRRWTWCGEMAPIEIREDGAHRRGSRFRIDVHPAPAPVGGRWILHRCQSCGYREHIGAALCAGGAACQLHTCPNCRAGDLFGALMDRIDYATADGTPLQRPPWRPGLSPIPPPEDEPT